LVDGSPPASDPLVYTVDLGQVLTITFEVQDVEGDEVLMSVNTTAVVLDEQALTLTFDPGTEAVGTFSFGLRVWNAGTPTLRSVQNFTIQVVNPNDPMEDPVITQPEAGATFKVNQSISLVGECEDPDVPFGQELEFIWSSDLEGELGRGASIVVSFKKVGTHTITLTVKDPDFQRATSITLVLEAEEDVTPPPPPDDNGVEPGTNWSLVAIIVVVLVIVAAVAFLVVGKRTTESYEARMDEVEEAEEKKEALERTAQALKDVADKWETEAEAAKDTAAVEATRAAAEAEGWELEEVEPGTMAEGTDLGTDVAQAARTSWVTVEEPADSSVEEDPEARRVEDLKRTYQNAIGRLPFGIPSRELASWDWVDLTNALVTGERRTLEDGREVTSIGGRWYYSDPDDVDNFLKEYVARTEEVPKEAPSGPTDKQVLLARLEERFIMGEISEETYTNLRKKYGE
jgi:F0F1-type ATP synthase membrane subunit b/b'